MPLRHCVRAGLIIESARAQRSAGRLENEIFSREKRRFQGLSRRYRCERRGDAQDGAIEMVKSMFLDESGDFRSDPALPDGFVHYNDPAGFFGGIYNRFDVER